MRVFIGLENINPDNLLAANKRQNKITEYRHMLQQWHERGVFTFAGYIIGFPADTKESILRDVEIIKRELPLDVLEFFVLTPLPGSEDHRRMHEAGEWMDPDLNKYNLHHRVSHHPRMSDEEWDEAYHAAWRAYFTWEHMETVARRHARLPANRPKKALQYLNEFKMIYEIEGLHALEGGVLRRKRRRARRPTFRREPALTFYPAPRDRERGEDIPLRARISQGKGADRAHPRRSGALGLYRRLPAAADAPRSSRRSACSRRPAAAPRRWPSRSGRTGWSARSRRPARRRRRPDQGP